ncbi:MAG: DMT family transporter [Hyphomicrobiales bacterium]
MSATDSSQISSPTPAALGALAFTTAIWGVTPVFVRSFSLVAGPEQALIIRLIIVGVIFAVAMLFTSGFAIAKAHWPRLLFISLFGMLGYFVFSVFGFKYAPAGIGTLIMSTQPLLIALLAAFLGAEKLTLATVLGLVISFGGSVLLVSGDNLLGEGTSSDDLIFGCALIFLAGVTWSFYVVLSKPLIREYGPLKITGWSNVLIALPMLPFVRGETFDTLRNLPAAAWWALAFLSTFGASLSVVTWNYAAGHLRPSLLGASLYVVPVLAVIAGWAMLDEAVTWHIIIAAAVILLGVAISQIKKAR